MADPIGNEIPSPNAVRLPGLGAPELSVDYLRKLQEIVESLLGRRGSTWDRAVTFRDLQEGGLGGFIPGAGFGVPAVFNPGTGTITTPGGAFDIDAAIRDSAAYKDLLTRIGSAEELANLPEQISRQLEEALIDVARQRGNDIRTVENKLHNEQQSLAWRLDEITASLNTAAAGVREYNAAFADDVKAVATRVEQVAADLAAGGGGVEVQEQLTAISDAVEGLKGQWSLKIQTNPTSGQPPVIAGIALAVEDPIAGPGTSSLVFLADKVGFYTAGGTLNPFSIAGNQVKMTNVIAESLKVITPSGETVLDAAKTLAEQTRSNPNLLPAVTTWDTSYSGAAAYRNSASTTSGEYIELPANPGAGYIGLEQGITLPAAGGAVTLSCIAQGLSAGASCTLDIYNGSNVPGGQLVITPQLNVLNQYKATFTVPAGTSGVRVRAYLNDKSKGVQIAEVKLEVGQKVTAWSDDVITATNAKNRVLIPNLAALALYAGDILLGANGALRQGQTAYDVGNGLYLGADGNGDPALSMRASSGKYVRIRPSTDTFEFNQPTIYDPTFAAFTASLSGGPITSPSGANGSRSLGSRQITGSGGKTPYRSYLWVVTDLEGNPAARITISGETTDTVTVTGSGTNATARVRITGIITDANGMTASASFTASANFGAV